MALQVWLPLNGNLNNQGLNNITVSGGTIDNNGKLGKCYLVNKNSYISIAHTIPKTSNWTMTWWMKLPSSMNNATAWEGMLNLNVVNSSSGADSSSTINWANYHNVKIWDDANHQWKWAAPGTDFNYDKWHYWTLVHSANGTGVQCNMYIDGQSIGNFSNTTHPLQIIPGTINIGFGISTGGFYINDFRIYDHALSAKEIELLARGLVMHYPLNDNSIQVMNNCFNYPTFNTSSSSGGWSHWGASGASGSYGQTTDKNYIYRKDQTYAHWFANASTGTNYYILYQEPAFDGGFRSLCCILKEENGKEINESICWPSWNDNASGGAAFNKWTSVSPLGDGFYLCKCEGLKQNGSNDLVALDINPGVKIYVSECYLENDRTACSDIFYSSDIIYDSSGYNYNGTATSNITCSIDSSKYDLSTVFNENGDSITLPNIWVSNTLLNQLSVSIWFKTNTLNNTLPNLWSLGENSFARIRLASVTSIWYYLNINGTNVSSTYTIKNVLDNKWHHVVFIFENGIAKVFLDNELIGTTNHSSTGTTLKMGSTSWHLAGYHATAEKFIGSLSDFRIYATPLSEKVIQELYQMGASATKNGNLLTYEFKEV